jgi:hypothetical protein
MLVILLASCLSPCCAADNSTLVSVLEMDGNPKLGPVPAPPYIEFLKGRGIRVGYPTDLDSAPLTWERLKRFNVLVMTSSPNFTGHGVRIGDNWNSLLDRYLQEGGGILYVGQAQMSTWKEHDDLNSWLKPYGAQFEWAEVSDPAHEYKNPPQIPWMRTEWNWTTNIQSSPLTQGVKSLYYLGTSFYSPFMRPLLLGEGWQVVVKSEPTSVKANLERIPGDGVPPKIAGQSSVGAWPLMAVKQVGKGRIAVFGGNPGMYWFDLGKPVYAKIASERGDGSRSSDWLPLLENTLRWLSEPGRSNYFPGGETETVKFHVNPEYGSLTPINWELPDIATPDSEIYRLHSMHSSLWKVADWRLSAGGQLKAFKFLVGAKSRLSGGKGSVLDWKAAARKAGFDGVIFREDILSLSHEQWDDFQKECVVASDSSFLAVPGQEFTDWEGNQFYRFNRDIPYHHKVRLTPDGKRVRDQLSFFFDANWTANMPLRVKANPEKWWNYRVYSAFPTQVYDSAGKLLEDNTAEWKKLVERIEYPTPIAIHLLDDPAQVARATRLPSFRLLAASLDEIRTQDRWGRTSLGTGVHNSPAAFLSDGPIVEAFAPLNMYRATLGATGIPGSYRYQIRVRVRSDAALKTVEVWAGRQLLRRYRPNSLYFQATVDELHDRAYGLWLRAVDTAGKSAIITSPIVHDKQLAAVWCGDHCNQLPWGQGVTKTGEPTGIGIATHVKSMLQPASGPGADGTDALNYIPSGTDTSSPAIGTQGDVRFLTTSGHFPEDTAHYVPELQFWHNSRDVLITRMPTSLFADRKVYTNEHYGVSYISGWGPYFRSLPLRGFSFVVDDLDFHRDGGRPAFQMSRGRLNVTAPLKLAQSSGPNLVLGRVPGVCRELTVNGVPLTKPFDGILGRGGFVTYSNGWGYATVYAMDDRFAVSARPRGDGRFDFTFGLNLNAVIGPGTVVDYRFLLARWPAGTTSADALDRKTANALNLAAAGGYRLVPTSGTIQSDQFVAAATAKNGRFEAKLTGGTARFPVTVAGLNPNWSVGVLTKKQTYFPLGFDPDGLVWTQIDPVTEAGRVFVGHAVIGTNPDLILRVLPRTDGSWTVLAHNPTDKVITAKISGVVGGPLPNFAASVALAPGAEARI